MNKPEVFISLITILTQCVFEYEIPNRLKAKNRDEAIEDAELEPELEKVEEEPIVSKS